MPQPTPRNVLTSLYSNYWRASLVAGLYFFLGFVAWGGSRGAVISSSVFAAIAVLGLLTHRRVVTRSREVVVALILTHLLVGEAVLVWQQSHLPLTDYTHTGDTGAREVLIYLVSTLIVGTMSMFGGLRGAVLGLSAHYAFIFDPHTEFSFKWVYPILICLTGYIVSSAFFRLDETSRQLETLVSHDQLTGLFNRRQLPSEFERLQGEAIARGRSLLLVAWDLDDLKHVNDRDGHAAGDAYLRAFAEALRDAVRRPSSEREGDSAFRVGGDEFLSLHLDAPDGEQLLARVRQRFAAVSADWVHCERSDLDRALTLADAALYTNKVARKQMSGPA